MISIIIPVYNEENRLESGIDKVFAFIKKSRAKYEVILVDDGSKDSTGRLLLNLQKKYPFKVITHGENAGKGAAIRTGIDNSLGDLILFTDVDLSVPIEFVDRFAQKMAENDDIVIGTRVAHGAKIERKQFFIREFLGGAFTCFSNLLLRVGVSDFTCGFKLFRRKAAQKIFLKQLVKRWAFDVESLYLARKYHYRIKEAPVIWRHFGGSKVNVFADLVETLVSLFQIRFNDFRGKYD